ncbi:uncharacterized protein LOC115993057 isoform X3 [Quercus lobata]|uniref:uncharacterized protein LOC115993057 isoform X3 n=1 Tax=Quercus lobata TaxID=97700 RepID=UPI001247B5E9|nr:uncharacterized protein LOC115993057 isoform X3 [Quercus lobata]
MAASATASGGARKLCYSMSQYRHLVPTAKRTSTIKFFVENPVHFSRTRVKSTIPIRALDPQRDEETENPNINDKTGAFTSQEVKTTFANGKLAFRQDSYLDNGFAIAY